jgi:hypothetical protein
VCPQGHNDCLAKIAPERVVDAVCGLLELEPDPSPLPRILVRDPGQVSGVPIPQQ